MTMDNGQLTINGGKVTVGADDPVRPCVTMLYHICKGAHCLPVSISPPVEVCPKGGVVL